MNQRQALVGLVLIAGALSLRRTAAAKPQPTGASNVSPSGRGILGGVFEDLHQRAVVPLVSGLQGVGQRIFGIVTPDAAHGPGSLVSGTAGPGDLGWNGD